MIYFAHDDFLPFVYSGVPVGGVSWNDGRKSLAHLIVQRSASSGITVPVQERNKEEYIYFSLNKQIK